MSRRDEPRGTQRGTANHAADAAFTDEALSSCEILEFSSIDICSLNFWMTASSSPCMKLSYLNTGYRLRSLPCAMGRLSHVETPNRRVLH